MTFLVFAHVCSWYSDVLDARRFILTRSEIFPLSGTSALPGSDAWPAALRRARRLILPSEIVSWPLLSVWNVSIAVAFADTTLYWIVECRAAVAGSATANAIS